VLADELAREAEQRALFYCAVDDSRVGSFSHVAIARAGIVFAAVGSQGEAPALARRLREIFDELFARAGLAAFAERLAELRRVTPPEKRREVLDEAVRDVRLEGELVLPTAASRNPRV
jgi:siroheme synthase (precorrin-2 oxidase/ferrochelatase)